MFLAFEKGYYEIPRKIRTEDLAEELKITRYAVDRTLRSAENKIMRSIIPFFIFLKSLKHTQLKINTEFLETELTTE